MAKRVKSKKELEVEKKVSIPLIFYTFIIPTIPDYYSTYKPNFDVSNVACCPLHDEETPSMRYYEETNSCYCFGCRQGGGPVQLYQAFYNRMNDTEIETEEIVNFLYEYFIRGKDTRELDTLNTEDKSINTPVEMIILNKYRIDLERRISFNKETSLEAKEAVWKELDNIDTLLSKNCILAADAKKRLEKLAKTLQIAN